MVVNIYHVVTGNLLAIMGNAKSVEQAKLDYVQQFLGEEFNSIQQFMDKYEVFNAGLYCVALN